MNQHIRNISLSWCLHGLNHWIPRTCTSQGSNPGLDRSLRAWLD